MKKLLILVAIGVLCAAVLIGCPKKETVKPVEEPVAVMEPVVEEPVVEEPEPELDEAERLKAQAKAEECLAAIREFEAANIYFDYDRYNLRADARAVLDAKAQFLKAKEDITILIEGHCDERGTVEYNLALGQKRADAAKTYLINLGISPYRIQTVSYGEEKPAIDGNDEAALAKNRRDHFVVASGDIN